MRQVKFYVKRYDKAEHRPYAEKVKGYEFKAQGRDWHQLYCYKLSDGYWCVIDPNTGLRLTKYSKTRTDAMQVPATIMMRYEQLQDEKDTAYINGRHIKSSYGRLTDEFEQLVDDAERVDVERRLGCNLQGTQCE